MPPSSSSTSSFTLTPAPPFPSSSSKPSLHHLGPDKYHGVILLPEGLIESVPEVHRILQVIDWMESRGMKMSANKYAIHLDLIAKVKGIEFAESYFSSLADSGKDLPTYSTMLNSYCRENMVDKEISLYDKMKELNLICFLSVGPQPTNDPLLEVRSS